MIIIFLFAHFLRAQLFIEERRIGKQGSDVTFSNPAAVDISPDGLLYVVDSGNNLIRSFDLQGGGQKSIGGFGFKEDQFDRPVDIWARDLLNIFIADYNNQRVQRYNRTMHFVSSLTSDDSNPPEFQFTEVGGCAVNSQNDLFVLDRGENKIIKFNRHGQPERSFGSYESGEGELEEPQQMDIAGGRFLLITDRSRKALIIFDFFGNFVASVSVPEFKAPAGLAVDEKGQAFIADPVAQKIFVVAADFRKVVLLNMKLVQPLKRPLDLTIVKKMDKSNSRRLYLIDGNQLIVGRVEP